MESRSRVDLAWRHVLVLAPQEKKLTASVCFLFKRKCVRCDTAELHARQALVHPMQWPAEIMEKIQYEVRMAVQATHGVTIKDRMGWNKVHPEMNAKYEMYIEYEHFRHPDQFIHGGYFPDCSAVHPQVAFAYDLNGGQVFDPTLLDAVEHYGFRVTDFAVGCESLVSDWA